MTSRPTALITGASGGIGADFARRYGREGHDLVLVARTADRLEALAHEIRETSAVDVTVLAHDLGAQDAPRHLYDEVTSRGITVDTLVNNAGFASHGEFAITDPDLLMAQVTLNCVSLTGITALFLPGMLERRTGTIVNVASTSSFQPVPKLAVYAATKAFVLSFTESLWHETRGGGVRILALCPGFTDTGFFDVAQHDYRGRKRTTAQVVETTFRALRGSAPSVVDGAMNRFMARVGPRILPKRLVMAAAERFARQG